MSSTIYELKEGASAPEKKAVYSLPPQKALVCYIVQFLKHDMNTAGYPDKISGMRESSVAKNHWYYDESASVFGVNGVLAAYPNN